jgi:hypothetical protein
VAEVFSVLISIVDLSRMIIAFYVETHV